MNKPSPEAIRMVQGFLLKHGRKHHIRVKIEEGIGTDHYSKTVYDMQFTNYQTENIKELMTTFVQETNKEDFDDQ